MAETELLFPFVYTQTQTCTHMCTYVTYYDFYQTPGKLSLLSIFICHYVNDTQ